METRDTDKKQKMQPLNKSSQHKGEIIPMQNERSGNFVHQLNHIYIATNSWKPQRIQNIIFENIKVSSLTPETSV